MKELHPKVKAGGLAGAVTVLLVAVADQFGVEIGPEIASALTTVIGFLAGYQKSAD